MNDRIYTAWKLRDSLFTLIQNNPGVGISFILPRLAEYHPDTVRKAVYDLLRGNFVEIDGKGKNTTYTVKGETYKTLEETRDHAKLIALNASQYAIKVTSKKEPPKTTGRIVHIVKVTDKPIPNQGGQGAVRRKVYVNCDW